MVRRLSSVLVDDDQPLIGIFVEEGGHTAMRYFTSEDAAREAVSGDATQDALDLAGAWSDLDWDEMASELDRIRHESAPSPPLSL